LSIEGLCADSATRLIVGNVVGPVKRNPWWVRGTWVNLDDVDIAPAAAPRYRSRVTRKPEDPEIVAMLRACQEPPRQRVTLVLGLVGAFAAGGVVFMAVTRMGSLRGWGGALVLLTVLLLFVGLGRRRPKL
jgi:hypothetical protein